MNWITIKKEDFVSSKLVNKFKAKYHLGFNLVDVPKETEEQEFDGKYLQVTFSGRITVDVLKNILVDLQKQYDKDAEVQTIIIDGHKTWYDNNKRLAIINSIRVAEENGETTFKLYINSENKVYEKEMSIEDAKQLFNTIETYCMECNDVTQSHLMEIQQLETINECYAYQITKDYPNYINH